MTKGDDWERKFIRYLWENNCPAIRIPGSGAGTDRELPDIITNINGRDYLIEHKFTSRGYCYLQEKEVRDLQKIAGMWDNAIPLAVARFSGDTTWYCLDLRKKMEEFLTSSGNLSIRESSKDRYKKIQDLITHHEENS